MTTRAIALRAALCTAVLLSLSGCVLGYLSPSFVLPGERRDRLDEAAQRYAQALRFGYLEQAALHVEPDQRREFMGFFAHDGNGALRFTDVEVSGIEFRSGFGRATVLLQAHVYRLPSVREQRLSETQRWRYDPGARSWYVSPDFELYQRGAAPGATSSAAPGPTSAPPTASAPRSR